MSLNNTVVHCPTAQYKLNKFATGLLDFIFSVTVTEIVFFIFFCIIIFKVSFFGNVDVFGEKKSHMRMGR